MFRALLTAGQNLLAEWAEKPAYIIIKMSSEKFAVTSVYEAGLHEFFRRTWDDGPVDQLLTNIGVLLHQPTMKQTTFPTLEGALRNKWAFQEALGVELKGDTYLVDTTRFADELKGAWEVVRISWSIVPLS